MLIKIVWSKVSESRTNIQSPQTIFAHSWNSLTKDTPVGFGMKIKIRSALVLSPHTDDMELGTGATIRKLVENNIQVKSVVFSDCKKSLSGLPKDTLRKECRIAADHLGVEDLTIHEFPVREFPKFRQKILDELIILRKDMKPDLVIAPWSEDQHQDHQTLGKEAIRAFMRKTTSVWAFQVPGSCPGFTPQVFIPITDEEAEKKIEMLQSYKSQINLGRDYFTPEKIKAFLSYFGTFIGQPYAEGFVEIKSVFKELK